MNGMSSKTIYGVEDEKYTAVNKTTVEAVFTNKVGLGGGTVPMGTAKIDGFFTFKDPGACKISRFDVSFEMGKKA